ncbi:MAG: hypothetical protein IKR39_10525 [Lachnospiraceae bacterium]|nr:hypothetical protein [Lachnospiraceae bacterium]
MKKTVIKISLYALTIISLIIIWAVNGSLSMTRIGAAIGGIIVGCGLIWLSDKYDFMVIRAITDTKIGGMTVGELIILMLIVVFSILVRFKMLSYESEDFIIYNGRWVDQIREIGWHSFGCNISNYSPLYVDIMILLSMTGLSRILVVKMLPMLFDYALGAACVKLFEYCTPGVNVLRKILIFGLIILNPVIVLNSSAWGQCDSIYSFFIVMSLYAMIKAFKDERYSAEYVFIYFAIAFALKLQAVFFLPVLMLCVFVQKKRKFQISQFVYIPIIYLAPAIPMLIEGKSLKDVILVYFSQTGQYSSNLSMRYYNFFSFIGQAGELTEGYFVMGVVLAATVLGLIFYKIISDRINLSGKSMLFITCLTIMVLTFFLPSMHERYAYAGEIVLIILAVMDRRAVPAAAGIAICSLISYSEYLSGGTFAISQIGSILIALTRLVVILYLINESFKGRAVQEEI